MSGRRPFLLLLAALPLAAFALPALAATPEKLFFIQRSKNADEVHYDARVNADGTLDGNNPVDGYWMNKNPDGSFSRAELTMFQRMAYGYDTAPTGNGTYALKLKAFGDRRMWIVKANGHWRVQTTIAGKNAFLKRLYVATKEGGLMPTVLYVDVFGEDGNGAAVTEHIVKD